MREIKVWTRKHSVDSAISEEVEAAFLALLGGLVDAQREASFRSGHKPFRREAQDQAMAKIDALEEMTLSVVAASICRDADEAREELRRAGLAADFKEDGTALALAHHGKGINGHAWIRRQEEKAVITVTISGKDFKQIGEEMVRSIEDSFDEAYDRISAERETIVEEIEALFSEIKAAGAEE